MNAVTDKRLLSIIERIERLEAEKAGIADDIKEIKQEAKSAGYEVKTINEIIKLRKLTQEERQEREAMRDTYLHAIGMLADTPLGNAGLQRATGGAKGGDTGTPAGGKKVDVVSPADLPGETVDPEPGEVTEAASDDWPETGDEEARRAFVAALDEQADASGPRPGASPPALKLSEHKPAVTERVASAVDAVKRMMAGPQGKPA